MRSQNERRPAMVVSCCSSQCRSQPAAERDFNRPHRWAAAHRAGESQYFALRSRLWRNCLHADSSSASGGRQVIRCRDASGLVRRWWPACTPEQGRFHARAHAGFESAADPAISFDGKRILFAAKRTAADRWNIFEMKADGSDSHQITQDSGNCRSPMYQSALFYLNDERPSYQVTFVSDLAGEFNEYGPPAATNLYSVRFDGTRLRRLTYGVSASYDPFQMQDGRILFSHWERSHLGNGVQGRIDLFAVHLDGTDYAAFSGTQGPRIKHMACTTSKGTVVFVESGHLPWDGAGSIGVLSLRRNLHSYRAITAPPDGLFHSPSPLPDGSVLVSRRSRRRRTCHLPSRSGDRLARARLRTAGLSQYAGSGSGGASRTGWAFVRSRGRSETGRNSIA